MKISTLVITITTIAKYSGMQPNNKIYQVKSDKIAIYINKGKV